MTIFKQVGFIGLGVMGEPVCRNLAQKSGIPVLAFDNSAAPLERLAAHGKVRAAANTSEVARTCDVVFLALPSGEVVDNVVRTGEFPDKAFSVDYARKDLRYALQLAQQTGIEALGARNVETWFAKAIEAGHAQRYWPVISRIIDSST